MSPSKSKTAHTPSCDLTRSPPASHLQTSMPGRPRKPGDLQAERRQRRGQEARRGAMALWSSQLGAGPTERVRRLAPAGGQMIVFGWVLADIFAE